MTDDSLSGLSRRLDRLADDLGGKALRDMLHAVGKAAKDDVAHAARGDIGDLSMSNWRRGRPIQITARYELVGDSGLEVLPAKRAAGPVRVLESGRKAGQSRARRGRSSRRVSATAGKGTWTAATERVERLSPARIKPELTKAIARQFKG